MACACGKGLRANPEGVTTMFLSALYSVGYGTIAIMAFLCEIF